MKQLQAHRTVPKGNERPLVPFNKSSWEGPWEAMALELDPDDG